MNMTDTETDTETVVVPRKRTDVLKSQSDRLTREPAEHPDRIPSERPAHPVTRAPRAARSDRPA
jgi:hypothetical protein